MTTENHQDPAPDRGGRSAFFSVNSPTDPVARLQREEQRIEYLKWRSVLPSTDEDRERDFTEYAATLTRSTGQQPRFIEQNLHALTTLDRLPRLRALVEELYHVDMRRLRTIETQVSGISVELQHDDEFWECLDTRLVSLLTATRANQLMPGADKVRNAIKNLVRAFTPPEPEREGSEEPEADDTDPEEDEQHSGEPESTGSYDTWSQPDGSVSFEVRLDQPTATMIDEAVRTRAAAENISRAQAFIELILANVAVSVSLNLYKSSDLPDTPGFLQPYGPLDPSDTAALAQLATSVRDADEAGAKKDNGYQASPPTRAHVEGRDRICRWPGCTVPAHRCQVDHRINFEDGGETTASNLLSLCQHHHNRKTDEQAHYLLDPVTGHVYWLFSDGTWTVDLADGPLAPRQKRWNQTLAQKLKRRQERARQRAADEEARQRRKLTDNEEEPPF